MEDYIDIPIKSFRKGWIPNTPDNALVGIQAFSDCNNVRVQYGDVSKIHGWVKTAVPQLFGEIRKFVIFNRGDATEKLTAITSRGVYEIVFPATAIDRTDATFSLNNESVDALQFADLLIIVNNHVTVKKWTGSTSTITDLAGISAINLTAAKTIESNNEFVILGNCVVSGTRMNKTVFWCDRRAPETWLPNISNEAGDLDFLDSPGEIVRIKKMGELNITYKEDDIEFLIFVGLPFTYARKFFTGTIGLLAYNAVEENNNVHYLVGSDFDLYRFDGINLVSLGSRNGIRDYIRSNIDMAKVKEVRVDYDPDYKEMRFIFPRKSPTHANNIRFEVVYNIEEQQFTRRDSITVAAGVYKETVSSQVADSFAGVIVDTTAGIPANLFGQHGIPKYKPIISDKDGFIYYYNQGNSFDTSLDFEAFIETGDEDFEFLRRMNIAKKTKQVSEITYLSNDQGTFYNVEVKVGVRNALNKNLIYKGPYTYKQNTISSGKINPRATGVYHRYRFSTSKKNQYFSLLGFIIRLEIIGDGRA